MNRYSTSQLACGLIVIAAALAHYNGLFGQPVYDDTRIRNIQPQVVNWAAEYSTLPLERWLVNGTFAINRWYGTREHFWYHLTNLAIHVSVALLLFWLVKRYTSVGVATVSAILFAVHPLTTNVVAYETQRYESMGVLVCLLALAAHLKYRDGDCRARIIGLPVWLVLAPIYPFAVLASNRMEKSIRETLEQPQRLMLPAIVVLSPLFAFGCKLYFVVILPAIIVLHDLWHRRRDWAYWYALVGTMFLCMSMSVAYLVPNHIGNTPTMPEKYGFLTYWAIETNVLAHYTSMIAWPSTMLIDYGWHQWDGLVASVVVMCLLTLAFAIYRLWQARHPAALFLLMAAIFVCPTMLIPMRDSLYEYRAYAYCGFILAAVAVLVRDLWPSIQWRWAPAVAAAAFALTARTIDRNEDYFQPNEMYRDVALNSPTHWRGWALYASHLYREGRFAEAEQWFAKAASLPHCYLWAKKFHAFAILRQGRVDEARAIYVAANKP